MRLRIYQAFQSNLTSQTAGLSGHFSTFREGFLATKKLWLNEAQLGDLFWVQYLSSKAGVQRLFREFQIGRGRVDFATFSQTQIDLFELKITADITSIIQVHQYRCDMLDYSFDHFMRTKAPPMFDDSLPRVNSFLVARHFDTGVQEVCARLGIKALRLKLLSKDEIEIVDESIEMEWKRPEDPGVPTELFKFYGAPNGTH